MDKNIKTTIEKYSNEALLSLIMSNPRTGDATKEKIRPVAVKQGLCFQVEKFRGTQVFHENIEALELPVYVEKAMLETYKQAELKHRDANVTILVSKSGTVTIKEKRVAPVKLEYLEDHGVIRWDTSYLTHNRAKNYLIPEGSPVPFLQELGVFTADGALIKAKSDKYRQINRFLEFVDDIVPNLPADRCVNILDFGCGKSYLTFAVYYFLTKIKGRTVHITGLDIKKDVVAHCESLARKYGYDGLEFKCCDVADFARQGNNDMMITLHACDTATDHALAYAIKSETAVILSVPCCQHELNGQFENSAMAPLFNYGIIKERVAALATDALRAEILAANNYKVQILEFIDLENTPKNLLIRAVKRNREDKKACEKAKENAEAFIKEYNLRPMLKELLEE